MREERRGGRRVGRLLLIKTKTGRRTERDPGRRSHGLKQQVQTSACQGFPGGAVVKIPPANAGDTGSSPGPERSHVSQSN